MNIVIACDSFKNCLTSEQVGTAIAKGIKSYALHYKTNIFVTSDGGEGSIDSYVKQCQGEYVFCESVDAYGNPIKATYCLIESGTCAVIEIAKVIGLGLREKELRRPFQTSSIGVAALLLDAKKRGVKRIILCLGGSCTNDAGVGLLEGLGARFYDRYGLRLHVKSGVIGKINSVDFSDMDFLIGIEIIAASDVKNTLLGKEGATFCFGKQKGIYPTKMKQVEAGMQNYVHVVKRQTGIELDKIISGGAAGGIGSALIGILKAKSVSGIQLLIEKSQMEEAIKQADLVITGEGQSDLQTKFGKVPAGIIQIANKYNVPTLCISGALGYQYMDLYELGFIGIVSIADRAMSFHQALELASEKLEQCAYTQIRMLDMFSKQIKKV